MKKKIDLFERYDLLPKNAQEILSNHSNDDQSYENCDNLLKKMNAIGYTFDYYLDAVPYNLRAIGPQNLCKEVTNRIICNNGLTSNNL